MLLCGNIKNSELFILISYLKNRVLKIVFYAQFIVIDARVQVFHHENVAAIILYFPLGQKI